LLPAVMLASSVVARPMRLGPSLMAASPLISSSVRDAEGAQHSDLLAVAVVEH